MDIKYTASLEEDLNEIAKGNKKYLDVVTSVYGNLQEHIKKSESEGVKMKDSMPTTGVKCLVCKEGEIAEKKGKFGNFFSCSKYPDCKAVFVKDEDGKFHIKEKKEIKTTGRKCPECEKKGRNGEIVERKNKSTGDVFYACNKFPTCKFVERQDGDSPRPKKDFTKKAKEDFDSEAKDDVDTENKDDVNIDFLEDSDSK